LSLPIDCPDSGCLIQSFVDIDPGPGRLDHSCGAASYDGHTGTDIRLADLLAMTEGIPARAAAAGVVTATRDGIEDRYYERGNDAALRGRGCGNGVIIDHGGGWTTQYCHLRNGSITVREGDRLNTGDRIGLVGLSGRTEFPHLELIVRKGDRVLDPFALDLDGIAQPACGTSAVSLWTADAAAQLPYPDAVIINTGFADAVPTLREVDNRARTLLSLENGTPALVGYGRVINLKTGDVLRVSLRNAAGAILAQGTIRSHGQSARPADAGRRYSPSGLGLDRRALQRGHRSAAQRCGSPVQSGRHLSALSKSGKAGKAPIRSRECAGNRCGNRPAHRHHASRRLESHQEG
jgi:hypothetical protein